MAKEAEILTFYSLRLGKCDESSKSDFYDNQGFSFSVADGEDSDGEEWLLAYIPSKKLFFAKKDGCYYEDFIEDIGKVAQEFFGPNVEPGLVNGLIAAVRDADCDGIINFSDDLENNCFEATPKDDVEDFKPCLFGVGSSHSDCLGARINLETGIVAINGEDFENLSDLFGEVDEDEHWAVGVRI